MNIARIVGSAAPAARSRKGRRAPRLTCDDDPPICAAGCRELACRASVACGAHRGSRSRRSDPLYAPRMFEDRSYKRTFYSAPQSVTSLVAAFLEPRSRCCVLPGDVALADEPIGPPGPDAVPAGLRAHLPGPQPLPRQAAERGGRHPARRGSRCSPSWRCAATRRAASTTSSTTCCCAGRWSRRRCSGSRCGSAARSCAATPACPRTGASRGRGRRRRARRQGGARAPGERRHAASTSLGYFDDRTDDRLDPRRDARRAWAA